MCFDLIHYGQTGAPVYPLWALFSEHRRLTTRRNTVDAHGAVLLQKAVASVMSKEVAREFSKTIKSLYPDN